MPIPVVTPPVTNGVIQSVQLMPLAPLSEAVDQTKARSEAEPEADSAKVLKSQLIGSDNFNKSFFYRSFLPKEPRSASIAVMRYDSRGDRVYVSGVPEEHRFIISSISMTRAENVQIMQTFGEDLDILQTFGAQPQIWQFRGSLRNERRDPRRVRVWMDDGTYTDVMAGDGDWRNGFVEAYTSNLRASQLVRRGRFLELTVGDMLVYGYIINLSIVEVAQMEMSVEFQMDFFVRDVQIPDRLEIPELSTQLDING